MPKASNEIRKLGHGGRTWLSSALSVLSLTMAATVDFVL